MRLAPHRLRVISTDSQLPVGRQRARNAEVRFGHYLRGFQHPPKFTYKGLSEVGSPAIWKPNLGGALRTEGDIRRLIGN